MKSNKIKIKLIIVLLLLITIAGGGLSLAYLMSGSKLVNTFEVGNVKTEIVENFDGSTKTDVKIKNIGNLPAYIRCKIAIYYEYQDGEKTLISNKVPKINKDYKLSLNLGNDWFEVDGIYYYKYPLDANLETSNLINRAENISSSDNDKLVVDIYTQAIQIEPSKAVEEAWKDINVNSKLELERVVK